MTKKHKAVFTVLNEQGLHARPSTEIVKCTSIHRAQISLTYKNNIVNGKSLLGILMLAAPKGSKIYIEAEGADAEIVIEKLLKLAENKFNVNY